MNPRCLLLGSPTFFSFVLHGTSGTLSCDIHNMNVHTKHNCSNTNLTKNFDSKPPKFYITNQVNPIHTLTLRVQSSFNMTDQGSHPYKVVKGNLVHVHTMDACSTTYVQLQTFLALTMDRREKSAWTTCYFNHLNRRPGGPRTGLNALEKIIAPTKNKFPYHIAHSPVTILSYPDSHINRESKIRVFCVLVSTILNNIWEVKRFLAEWQQALPKLLDCMAKQYPDYLIALQNNTKDHPDYLVARQNNIKH